MIFFFPNSQTTGVSHSANTTSHKLKSQQVPTWPPMNKTIVFHSLRTLLCSLLDCRVFVRPLVTLLEASLSRYSRRFVCARPHVVLLVACASPCCLQHLVLRASPCQMLSIWIEDTILVSTHDAGVISLAEVNVMKFVMKKTKCECVRLCVLCLCLVVERRRRCDYCVCPLLH